MVVFSGNQSIDSIPFLSQNTVATRLPAEGTLNFDGDTLMLSLPLTTLEFSLWFVVMEQRFIPSNYAV